MHQRNVFRHSLDTLVKGLSSDDKHQSAQALEEADKYLNSQQGFSKTVINRSTGNTSVVSGYVGIICCAQEIGGQCLSMCVIASIRDPLW